MKRILSDRQLQSLFSLYLILVYVYGVFASGAWSDDYSALSDSTAVGMHALRDSRPIYGLSLSFLFGFFDSISELSAIRFLGLVGLLLLNNEIWVRFRNHSKHRMMMGFCTFALTLPSFQFSAHWAVAFAMSWACFLALLGFRFFSMKRFRSRIFGLLALILSMLTYPLMAFFIFPVVFLEGLMNQETGSQILKRLVRPFWFLFLGGTTSYIASALVIDLLDTTPNDRVELTSLQDIPAKLFWFFSRPWALSFRPYLISSPSFIDIACFVLIFSLLIFFLLYFSYKSLKNALYIFGLFNFSIVLSLLPLLVVSQNQIEMRFLASNTWLALVTLLYLLSGFIIERFRAHKTFLGLACFISLFIFGFWATNDRYLNFIQPIYKNNQLFLDSEFALCTANPITKEIEIVERSEPWGSKPLIGLYSQVTDMESEWVPEGLVTSYVKSNNLSFSSRPVFVTRPQNESSCQIRLDSFRAEP